MRWQIEMLRAVLELRRRDGEHDLLDTVFLHGGLDLLAVAHDGDSHQQCAPFGGIVVNDAHDLIFRVRAVLKFTDDHGSRGAAADEHGASARALLGSGALIAQQTVDKARERDRDEQHQNVNKRIAARHGQTRKQHTEPHRRAGTRRGKRDAHELMHSRKLPQTVVKPEYPENNDRDERIEPHVGHDAAHKSGFRRRCRRQLEAQKQRRNSREIYYHNVRQQQTRYSQQLLRIYILINELSHFFPQRITKTPIIA